MTNGRWKAWASSLKSNTYALYLASRDARVPLLAKIIIGVVVAYALSPIDLIPDFIPIVGYLDDLLLLPLGIWLAIRMVPDEVWTECQAQAVRRISELPCSRWAGLAIVLVWLVATVVFVLWARELTAGL